ncbi:MAG: hypothetical protein JEZ11_03965 [Desulfobacterales bacterium]|nr:hypothetical protein [Desulfobacterales bacterium]
MRGELKTLVRGCYSIQKLRIQTGNRIVANFKAKMGLEPSQKEDELDKEGQALLKSLRLCYATITEGVVTDKFAAEKLPTRKKFRPEGVISSYTELVLVDQYMHLVQSEKRHFEHLKAILEDYPVWNEFLVDVKGIGPAMAGVLLSELDIFAAEYPSSFWAYAGLDVAEDGKGRSRRADHLIDVEYTAADGTIQIKKSITFNPFLKTKLMGVLSASFLRQKAKSPYSVAYYQYKNRIENMPAHAEKTKLHIHNMALRYAVKRFLVDFHMAWRKIEGLPVSVEYSAGKLGMTHKMAA